jgi:hypothetical protein
MTSRQYNETVEGGGTEGPLVGGVAFEYEHFDLTQQVFRLLEVHPRQPNAPIKVRIWHSTILTQYRCLSYMWGNQTERHTIVVNDRTFRVGRNLHDFLDHASRYHSNQPLWIDAICIDQDNNAERGHQVQKMGQIYSGAEEVLVWLGREFHFDLIADWLEAVPYGDYCSRDIEQQLTLLCFHPYWSRAWIAQEILLQSNVTILQQQGSIPWGEFGLKVLPLRFRDFAKGAPVMALVSMWLERYIREWATDTSVSVWTATGGRLKEFSFWQLLESRGTAECSDSRDRIYSLLAIPAADGPGTELKADYEIDSVHLFLDVADLLGVWNKVGRARILLHALDIDAETLCQSHGNHRDIDIPFRCSPFQHSVYGQSSGDDNSVLDIALVYTLSPRFTRVDKHVNDYIRRETTS